MKYRLIIEGTKEEIEKAKTYEFDCFADIPGFGDNPIPTEVEFKIVEPKYRIKTLVELVMEYGEEVKVGGTHVGYVEIRQCTVAGIDLGGDPTCHMLRPAHWKQIFLKEITNE